MRFRDLTPEAKDDAIAKALGLKWEAYAREVEKGRDPDTYISAIAGFAVKQVRSDRDVTGQEKAKDVLSRHAQKRKRLTGQSFTEHDTSTEEDETLDARHGHRESFPDEAAAFRHDFPLLIEQFP